MFQSGQLLLPKQLRSSTMRKIHLGRIKASSLLVTMKASGDASMLTQSIHSPKPKVNKPSQNWDVLSLQESDKDDTYEAQEGYVFVEASDDDF